MNDNQAPGRASAPVSDDAISRIGWLRPYYLEVARRTTFANLSPSHQFQALIDRVAGDHPGRAAKLADSTAATARAILDRLAELTGAKRSRKEVALWTVRKGSRELRCVAVYHSHGIDLRLLERADFRQTTLFATPAALTAAAADWLEKLVQRGWVQPAAHQDPAAGGSAASGS